MCKYFRFKRSSCSLLHCKSVSYKKWFIPRTLTINTHVAFAYQRRQLHKISEHSQVFYSSLKKFFFHGRISCRGFYQSQLTQIAAQKAILAAEEYFKLGNLDMAIEQAFAALDFNPKLTLVHNYIAAYLVHKFASSKAFTRGRRGTILRSCIPFSSSRIVLLLMRLRSGNITKKRRSWFTLTKMIRLRLRVLSRLSIRLGRLSYLMRRNEEKRKRDNQETY